MRRRRAMREFVSLALVLLQTRIVGAQVTAKAIVIGLLDAGARPEWVATVQRELRELGYIEGRNVNFEQRYGKGKPEALPALANELV